MLANEIKEVLEGRPFYITVTNFDKADIHLSKHYTLGEFADAPAEIIHIKDERFFYLFGAHANNIDS